MDHLMNDTWYGPVYFIPLFILAIPAIIVLGVVLFTPFDNPYASSDVKKKYARQALLAIPGIPLVLFLWPITLTVAVIYYLTKLVRTAIS